MSDADDNVISVPFGQAEAQAPAAGKAPADLMSRHKHVVFSKLIERGQVHVVLDPRVEGVCVPEELQEQEELVLSFSHRFFLPDFTHDDHAVCGSLAFGRQDVYCVVPWAAVRGLLLTSTGESVWWEEEG